MPSEWSGLGKNHDKKGLKYFNTDEFFGPYYKSM